MPMVWPGPDESAAARLVSSEMHHEEIKRLKSDWATSLAHLRGSRSSDWILESAVFEARIALISEMIKQGLVRAGEERISVSVRVEIDTVSAAATGGRNVSLPDAVSSLAWTALVQDAPTSPW